MNADSKQDVIAFVRNTATGDPNDVNVSLTNATGTGLLPTTKWSDAFCSAGELCTAADVDGDGDSDLIAFVRSTQAGDLVPFVRNNNAQYANDVWVLPSWGSAWRQTKNAPALVASATLLRSDEILVAGGGQNNCCRAGSSRTGASTTRTSTTWLVISGRR